MSVPIKLFINYSAEDNTFAEALSMNLALLKRNGTISEWTANEIAPDAVVTQQIEQNLQTSDVVLLLLSSAYFANDNCWMIQETAFKQNKNVVPIILSPCQWKLCEPIAALSPLPQNAKPIKLWDVRDEAYNNIVEALIKVIDTLKGNKTASSATTIATTTTSNSPAPPNAHLLNRRYTCNRRNQREEFESKIWELTDEKLLIYYIHGEEAQSTAGLYRCLRDVEMEINWEGKEIRRFERTILLEPKSKLPLFKIDFLQKTAKVLELNWQRSDLMTANLLTFADAVCTQRFDVITLGIEIDSRYWADGDTDGFFNWFNNEFCNVQLEAKHPVFVFFFMIDYYQNATEISTDLGNILQKSAIKPILLPELTPVKRLDIEFWFRTVGLKEFAAENKLLQKYFSDVASLEMQAVEKLLEKIIIEYNTLLKISD
ncbi:MAG: toll/interleukin-1 receptor domain-containing protein [Sphingobacteriales bacterium]|nr:toll/interleukin-1 receptor domain-containing protein [Sphingobacteriales bacterium]